MGVVSKACTVQGILETAKQANTKAETRERRDDSFQKMRAGHSFIVVAKHRRLFIPPH